MDLKKEKSPIMLAHDEGCRSFGVVGRYVNNNGFSQVCQDSVAEVCQTRHELSTKFTPKKISTFLLADSYKRLGYKGRSERVSNCGTYLSFGYEVDSFGVVSELGKLHTANFCRDRLCPMCSWRRSYKIFGQVSRIMDLISSDYKFLFLTLTVPNCQGEELSSTLDNMMAAYRKMIRYKQFKIVKGFFRALEITRNNDSESNSFGSYHPHFHVVLAVPKMYGKSGCYITRDTWLKLWQRAMGDFSITQVDIRLAKSKSSKEDLSSAVAEIAKYSVKQSDYLHADFPLLTDEIVSVFSDALFHRRLVAYGGIFKTAFDRLQLDDPEDGDLIHLDDRLNQDIMWLIVKYGWSCGTYKLIDSYIKSPCEEVICVG